MERGNTTYLLQEGLAEDEEKLNDINMLLLSGEGRNEESSGQGQPGSGAAAAERVGARELRREDPSGTGAACLMDILNQKGHGAGSSDQKNDKQPKEPVPKDIGVTECVQPVSVLVCQRCFYYKFSQWQLQELERFFQHNHYITVEVR
ncbi:rhox homeobox family member 2 [Sigmodon hispidus]